MTRSPGWRNRYVFFTGWPVARVSSNWLLQLEKEKRKRKACTRGLEQLWDKFDARGNKTDSELWEVRRKASRLAWDLEEVRGIAEEARREAVGTLDDPIVIDIEEEEEEATPDRAESVRPLSLCVAMTNVCVAKPFLNVATYRDAVAVTTPPESTVVSESGDEPGTLRLIGPGVAGGSRVVREVGPVRGQQRATRGRRTNAPY